MKRVVITGIGIISSIGNNKKKVLNSLINLNSGIYFSKKMKNKGMNSNIFGKIKINFKKYINKRNLRFMNYETVYTYIAMKKAIKDSNLKSIYKNNYKVGLITGSSINSPFFLEKRLKIFKKKKNIKFLGPYLLLKSMSSNISACLSTFFNIKGLSYSISSACTTTSNCIINAYKQVKLGNQDIIFAGGGEEISLELSSQFDAINLLSSKYNKKPNEASRPYDKNRDGFVITGGGGILVIESLENAINRKAFIYCEIISYAFSSDGFKILSPSLYGIIKIIKKSIKKINISIDYINTHATSTILGDIIEFNAMKKVFKNKIPNFSSTKSLTGHSLGVSGVHELIYSILMMKNNFIFPNINIKKIDKNFNKNFLNLNKIKKKNLNVIMSNNFGFGGNNTSLVIRKI